MSKESKPAGTYTRKSRGLTRKGKIISGVACIAAVVVAIIATVKINPQFSRTQSVTMAVPYNQVLELGINLDLKAEDVVECHIVSRNNVSVMLELLDETNVIRYRNQQSYSSFACPLSGTIVEFSGNVTIPYAGHWYIIIANRDPIQKDADVAATLTLL